MGANQAFPTVNEDECSWADISLNCNIPGGKTVPLLDVEAIKWDGEVEVGETRGTSGGRVMKQTAGQEKSTASITLTRSADAVLCEALEAAAVALEQVRGNEVAISGVRWDLLVQHTPMGSSRIYTTKLTGCRYLGWSSDNKQGTDGDLIEIPLNPIRIAKKSATGRWIVLR